MTTNPILFPLPKTLPTSLSVGLSRYLYDDLNKFLEDREKTFFFFACNWCSVNQLKLTTHRKSQKLKESATFRELRQV